VRVLGQKKALRRALGLAGAAILAAVAVGVGSHSSARAASPADLAVENNVGPVDVGDNTVTHDAKVQGDTPGGAIVNRNAAGHDATCQKNSPQAGRGNTAAHANGCPA
jgi:hypothetical protein